MTDATRPTVATQELRRLLELLARQHNPDWRPGTHTIRLTELIQEANLDLQDLPLQGAWLRGLDFSNLSGTPNLTGAHLLDTQGLAAPAKLPAHPIPLPPGTGHTGPVNQVIQLTDGSLVSASDDHTLRRWSAEGEELARFNGHSAAVTHVIQLTDHTLVSASDDHTLSRWSAEGEELARFYGHSGWVNHVIQLDDGSLVSASNDHTLRRWSLDGKELVRFRRHSRAVNKVIQLEDGSLVSASDD